MSLALMAEQAEHSIRRVWYEERMFFSVIDVIGVLPDAPALAWAEYYEQLAVLYRRQATCEARMEYVDARLDEHEVQRRTVPSMGR